MANSITCDVAIVGGGLAGGLIARALAERRPDVDVRLIEGGQRLGGNHVWSFFASDIQPSDVWLVAPLVSHAWTGTEVAFPGLFRSLPGTGYRSIESERFDAVIRQGLAPRRVLNGRRVEAVTATEVVLADGARIQAKGVIDARGPGDLGTLQVGWQKFVGAELELAEPHGQPHPRIMDATVEQVDGFRFVYTLPFAATRMFVEDTYFSDTPDFDPRELRVRIADYARARGWAAERVPRTEAGLLPMAYGGDFEAYWASTGTGIAKAGMRAGLFQPATGYSLPDAVVLAARIAATRDLSGGALAEMTHAHAARVWRERGFYRMLMAMFFKAAEPEERWRVIARFYRLDPALVRRFYTGRSSFADKARILAGKPPVPIGRALGAIREMTWR